ncbi:serine/threonine-protein kinase [Streptomyces sp. NPDC048172]|uniref:serine/threonine-protein kinase n=1 Tax=Streptomyces sp. NPDC048172 TaxID=3365505 RepID=UPI003717BC34
MPEHEVDGRYRLLRRIGVGGMGVVHEAIDLSLDRRVAVKILSRAGSAPQGEETRLRFEREARALARIDHTHVVVVHDVGLQGSEPYLVMELLDGVDLQQLVAARGPLPFDVVRHVGAAIHSALGSAHRAGVLHRDVKPSNVRLTRAGRVVLQDFGLARLAEESAITRVGALVGTPHYMAPEVIRGERPTEAADLYGLGLCLYWMLVGEPPLGPADADVGQVVERAVDTGVPRLRGDARRAVPEDLAFLVDGLSEREPYDRAVPTGPDTALFTSPGAESRLAGLVNRCVRERAVDLADHSSPAADSSAPEYLDMERGNVSRPAHGSADDPWALVTGADRAAPLSLSITTRQTVLRGVTRGSAVSRLREAVNLVQRGELQEASRVLAAVAQHSGAAFGAEHPTTLAAQFWQAVCLARLGAGGEAMALFSRVNSLVDDGRTDGMSADGMRERTGGADA